MPQRNTRNGKIRDSYQFDKGDSYHESGTLKVAVPYFH